MGKSKTIDANGSESTNFVPPDQPTGPGQTTDPFSQLNKTQNDNLQALRDHLVVVMAWNGLHDQMHLDAVSKQQSDEINQQIKDQ
jgi:hypothetical protein